MEIIKKIPRLFYVNLLWLLCCIPVITAGASTCAAFAVTLRLADDDEEVSSIRGITGRFFKAFKQDLVQGILIFIFSVVSFGLGGLFIYFVWDSGFNLIKIAAIAGYFLVVFAVNFYAYPLIARYSNSFVNTLSNSIALFLQYANASVKTLGIVLVCLAALYFTRYIFCVGLIILPAVIFYLISLTAKDIFVKLENPAPVEESEEEVEEGSEEEV